MKFRVVVEVDAPDGATHYYGELLHDPVWVKCTQIGVAGDHWWQYDPHKGWMFSSHFKPHWAKEIPHEHEMLKDYPVFLQG